MFSGTYSVEYKHEQSWLLFKYGLDYKTANTVANDLHREKPSVRIINEQTNEVSSWMNRY